MLFARGLMYVWHHVINKKSPHVYPYPRFTAERCQKILVQPVDTVILV